MNIGLRLSFAAALLLGGSVAMADHRYDNHGWRGNDGWRGGYDRYDGRGGWNNRNRVDTRWSVNVVVGSGYRVPPAPGIGWGWAGYPYGWTSYRALPPPVVTYSRPSTVVIQNNTTYVTPGTTVTYGTVAPAPTTSLFRDRYGRCHETRVDGLGNQIRTELPASACNF